MQTGYDVHAIFESRIYENFPTLPMPSGEKLNGNSRFQKAVKDLIAGKTWPEVIGARLLGNDIDASLSMWMRLLPLDIVSYYLPSHLVFASISLAVNGVTYYPSQVMEAFFLPPKIDGGTVSIEEMDDEIGLDAPIAENLDARMAIYKSLNAGQRACVGQYLSIYMNSQPNQFTEVGLLIYKKNIELWEQSSI